ncbi:hypothetical protein I3A86_23380, partial [Salmonella enterica]|nr:hypothetical protein [Salmonella enterica]
LGVFTVDRHGGGTVLVELAPGVSLDDIKTKTEAHYEVSPALVGEAATA